MIESEEYDDFVDIWVLIDKRDNCLVAQHGGALGWLTKREARESIEEGYEENQYLKVFKIRIPLELIYLSNIKKQVIYEKDKADIRTS